VQRGYFADRGAYARCFPKPRESENERIGNVSQHLNALMTSLRGWDRRSAVAQYAGPVLIVHGEGDFMPLESSREWQKLPMHG
jgi:pimeloyl-ACP methyl ester carboxylesterase